MTRPTYRVTVAREDGYWVAVVAGLRGAATERRQLSRTEDEVRDLVSWLTDTAADAFDLSGSTTCLGAAPGDRADSHSRLGRR